MSTDPDIAAVRDALHELGPDYDLWSAHEEQMNGYAALARVEARLEELEAASRELIESLQGTYGEWDGDDLIEPFVRALAGKDAG